MLGMANSRLKDYYDLLLISRTFGFELQTLSQAVRRTFERRGTPISMAIPTGLTDEFARLRHARWRAFIGRETMAPVPDDMTAVVTELRTFVSPVLDTVTEHWTWAPGGPWSA